MPSNSIHTLRPWNSLGTVNSVRYHQSVRQSASGIFSGRLFSPYVGSGYVPSATSDVRTVPGTTASCQTALPSALYAIRESARPIR